MSFMFPQFTNAYTSSRVYCTIVGRGYAPDLAKSGAFRNINEESVRILVDPSSMVGSHKRHFLFREALRSGHFKNLWIPIGFAVGIAAEMPHDVAIRTTHSHLSSSKDPPSHIHQPGFTGGRQHLSRVIVFGLTAPVTPLNLYTVSSGKRDATASFPLPGSGTRLLSQVYDRGFPFFKGHSAAPPATADRARAGLTEDAESVFFSTLRRDLRASPQWAILEPELWNSLSMRQLQNGIVSPELYESAPPLAPANLPLPPANPQPDQAEVTTAMDTVQIVSETTHQMVVANNVSHETVNIASSDSSSQEAEGADDSMGLMDTSVDNQNESNANESDDAPIAAEDTTGRVKLEFRRH